MGRPTVLLLVALTLALVAVTPTPAEDTETRAIGPEDVEGLEAWYRIESLHANHSEGDAVVAWKDSSGRGHHLQADLQGVKPVFVTQQLNGQPAVHVRRGAIFRVFQAFDLDDHTIFVVYRSDFTERALFRSEADDRRGLLLREEGRFHQYQNGDSETRYTYNTSVTMGKSFSILALGREDGVLGCFIDGRDVSSSTRFSDVIRVGTFFELEHTQYARSDGDGLHIAEMIFFDRYLSPVERNGVTRYLADKFGLEVNFGEAPESAPPPPPDAVTPGREAARVWMASHDRSDLNVQAFAIPWDPPEKLEAPFAHASETSRSRLVCERDGTRARLWVSAPLETKQAGTAIRLLVLKNGTEYLPDEAQSGPIIGPEGEPRKTLELSATLSLDAGDFVEIIAAREGADGMVQLQERGAILAVMVDGEVAVPDPGVVAEPAAPPAGTP